MILDLDRHPLAGATNTNEAALLQDRLAVSSEKRQLYPKPPKGALPLLACGQFTPGYLRLEEKGGCAFLLTPNIPEREAEPRIPVAPQAHAWLMKS